MTSKEPDQDRQPPPGHANPQGLADHETSDALRLEKGKPRLSINDALTDWQSGAITEEMALALTGATSRRELYVYCLWSDVPIVDEIPAGEMREIEALRQELSAT